MQKRFCSCGHMVMVRYECRKGVWMPHVIESKKVQRKNSNPVCPVCGSPLSIHTLR